VFELSWGKGQRLMAEVDFPEALTFLYQSWQQAYLNFYATLNSSPLTAPDSGKHLRGISAGSGGVAVSIVDWRSRLAESESTLLCEFHRWLRHEALYQIRKRLADAAQRRTSDRPSTQLFLTCTPLDLERFPWETWELGAEFSAGDLPIIRTPSTISSAAEQSSSQRKRARILAILGDDTGLNFEADRRTVRSLSKVADVEFVGWQPGQTVVQVIEQITQAIDDEQGWDVLFFAGHSNETTFTGGELGIAPGVSISMKEIETPLLRAKQRGLKVAIFNSCSGLAIANTLINLGFSQVVVMREPIHNTVAQEFLIQFLQALEKRLNIYEALVAARQFLLAQRQYAFPSAHLVASLFCHPGAELWQLPASGWRHYLQQLMPHPVGAIALTTALLLGSLVVVQDVLLDGRLLMQSLYRQATMQLPTTKPPVALVEIDEASLSSGAGQLQYLDRRYLAQIIDRLRELKAPIVGLDVVLDRPQDAIPGSDQALAVAIRKAVQQQQWLILAAELNEESLEERGLNQKTGIAQKDWVLQGYINANERWLETPTFDPSCRQVCPIAYLMAMVKVARHEIPDLPQPGVNRTQDLRIDFLDAIQKRSPQSSHLKDLLLVHTPFNLQPIIDFSIPPDRVFQVTPAARLFDQANPFPDLSNQIVLVAVGADSGLGMLPSEPDHFPVPLALHYWTQQERLAGGQSLAYMTHHFLQQRLVTPIPDIWMIGVAAVGGWLMQRWLRQRSRATRLSDRQVITIVLAIPLTYGLLSLQFFISAALVLPWTLPSAVFLAYVFPYVRRK
jgi:CHASE2 domain-containing sensor protein